MRRTSETGRASGARRTSGDGQVRTGRSSAIAARRRAQRRRKIMIRRAIAGGGLLLILAAVAVIIIVAANRLKDVKKLAISSEGTAITVQWAVDKHELSHVIYRDGEDQPVATVPAGENSFTIEEPKEAELYTYIVKTVKGKKTSKGKSISGYTGVHGVYEVAAQPISTNTARVEWKASSVPTSYKVSVSINPDMSEATVVTVNSKDAAKDGIFDCAIGSLKSNTPYYFTISAVAEIKDGDKTSVFTSDVSEPVKMLTMRSVTLDGIDLNAPMIALTFDDGPDVGGAITNRILDVFDKYQCYATFFELGDRAESNAEVMERMVMAGHEIGCHTYDHTHLGNEVTTDDIVHGDDAIEAACGVRPTAFRSPGGETTDLIRETCVSEKMPIYYWSVDSRDWESRDASSVISLVEDYAYDGSIVLMHNIYDSTAEAVESLVPWFITNGYQLVTVSQLIQAKTGQPPLAGVQYYDYQTAN